MADDKKWEQLFGFPRKDPDSEPEQHHCNLAFAIQKITEEIVVKMAREAKKRTDADDLCLAGGVALNCVANGVLLREKIFNRFYIQPCSGDAGGALGAALATVHIYFDQVRSDENSDLMAGAFLGPEFSEKEISLMSRRMKAVFQKNDQFENLAGVIAKEIANGKIAGWFQGRMEFGPRALGNRSILADARNPEMQKKLNLNIKYRESFRPFAPSVLAEDAGRYFCLDTDSPYMLLTAPVNESHRMPLPENYQHLTLKEKLYQQRSTIQAVTHVDFSARIQTVHEETNPRFAALIRAFKNQTDCSVLVNTSFNVRGEPIVCTPEDAYRCFMGTDMDILVIENFLFRKDEQPGYMNREKWRTLFKPD